MKSSIEGCNDFEYALIQYCGTHTFEHINIGVILKDEDRVDFKMIDSFHQITHAYGFQSPGGLDFPLEAFRGYTKDINIFKNGLKLCNAVVVFVPDIPVYTTKDDFEGALERLWRDCVKIKIAHCVQK